MDFHTRFALMNWGQVWWPFQVTEKQVWLNFHFLELGGSIEERPRSPLDPSFFQWISPPSISISDIYSLIYTCCVVCQLLDLLRHLFVHPIKDCSWTGTSCEKKVSLAKAVPFMEIQRNPPPPEPPCQPPPQEISTKEIIKGQLLGGVPLMFILNETQHCNIQRRWF